MAEFDPKFVRDDFINVKVISKLKLKQSKIKYASVKTSIQLRSYTFVGCTLHFV